MPDAGLNGMDIARSIALIPSSATTFALTTANTSAVINVGRSSFGSLHLVTLVTGVTLTAYASESGLAADFEAMTDANGSAVTIAVAAAGWFELPSACLSVPFLQLRLNAGSGTCRVYLKG